MKAAITAFALTVMLALPGCAVLEEAFDDTLDFVLDREAKERVLVRYNAWRDAGGALRDSIKSELNDEAISSALVGLLSERLASLTEKVGELLDRLDTASTPQERAAILAEIEQWQRDVAPKSHVTVVTQLE